MENEKRIYEKILGDSQEHTLSFSYRTIFEHALGIVRLYPRQLPKFVTVFVTIWASAEIFLLEDKSNLNDVVLPAIVISLIVSSYYCVRNYRNSTSEVIKNESNIIRTAFFKQKLGWQYFMAKEMIESRIIESDLSLLRIRQNAEYIPPKNVTDEEFIEFVKSQPEKVLRLLSAAKIACIHYLPNALSQIKKGTDLELQILKKEVDNVANIYIQAVAYERSIYEIVPSGKYNEVHEYMKGWTDPIREGISQLITLLDKLANIKKNELKNLQGIVKEYKIVFESPKNIDLFDSAVAKL
jgi:hypothetical protein